MARIVALALAACLGACAARDAVPELWMQDEGAAGRRALVFRTQRLHPSAKAVRVEATPPAAPRIESGEATVVYLYDIDGDVSRTVLVVLDHIPGTPWQARLPCEGVDIVYHSGSAADARSGSAVSGWIRIDEAGDRVVAGAMEVQVEGHDTAGAAARPVRFTLGGAFRAVR
jgi:hypothetical protein